MLVRNSNPHTLRRIEYSHTHKFRNKLIFRRIQYVEIETFIVLLFGNQEEKVTRFPRFLDAYPLLKVILMYACFS